jgi:hypothetical protein
MEIKEHRLAILSAAFWIGSLLFMNFDFTSMYAITATRVNIVTVRLDQSDPFAFALSATSTSTTLSGSGTGTVMRNNLCSGCFPPVTFTYSIDSLSISQTINGVNGKVGNTAHLTATVTESTNTNKVPIGSKFFITGNDPCCAFDPSSHEGKILASGPLAIVSFQGPLGGVYEAGVVRIVSINN